nr:hypothetical protein Iba_chr14dCG17940 [Ipomoea batatas]
MEARFPMQELKVNLACGVETTDSIVVRSDGVSRSRPRPRPPWITSKDNPSIVQPPWNQGTICFAKLRFTILIARRSFQKTIRDIAFSLSTASVSTAIKIATAAAISEGLNSKKVGLQSPPFWLPRTNKLQPTTASSSSFPSVKQGNSYAERNLSRQELALPPNHQSQTLLALDRQRFKKMKQLWYPFHSLCINEYKVVCFGHSEMEKESEEQGQRLGEKGE